MRVTKEELADLFDPLVRRMREYVEHRISKLPPPQAGAQGPAGAPGKDADPEAIRAAVIDVMEPFEREIREMVEGLRVAAKDGKDGRDGVDGKDGSDGAPGRDGAPGPAGPAGADGASVTVEDVRPLFDTAFAAWALDFERRAGETLERAVDRLPKPKDGRDGFGFEDLAVEHDGDGNVTLRFTRGEDVKEFALRLPRFKDRGVFREGESYLEGDGTTFGGSFWIAQQDAPPGKPGEGPDSGWRLAVKKGRDGRDGAQR